MLVPLLALLTGCPIPSDCVDEEDTADTGAVVDTAAEDSDSPGDSGLPDTGDSDEDDPNGLVDGFVAVMTTMNDWDTAGNTGALLATVDEDGVDDGVLEIGITSRLVVGDDALFLVETDADRIRRLDTDDLGAPLYVLDTGAGSAPLQAAVCNGALFVAFGGLDQLGVYDPASGQALATVPLVEWADEGGLAAAESLVAADGVLYVGLARTDASGWPSDTGVVLQVDCTTDAVVSSFQTGSRPRLTLHPDDPSVIVVATGRDLTLDGSTSLDGGLYTFDPAIGHLSGPHVTERDAGGNLGALAGDGQGNGLLVLHDGYLATLVCVDFETWQVRSAATPHAWIPDLVTAPDGQIWVPQSNDLGVSRTTEVGASVYDAERCARVATLTTTFPPWSIAFLVP